jgi:hypothetical protein
LALSETSGEILSPRLSAFMIVALSGPVILLAVPRLWRIRQAAAWLGLAGLTAGLFAFRFFAPDVFATSAAAILSNMMTAGVWGPLWWLLIPAIICSVAFGPTLQRESAWFLIVIGFFAIVLILGGAREFPFRLGFGDSANRMLTHIVPLAAAYVVAKVLDAVGSRG